MQRFIALSLSLAVAFAQLPSPQALQPGADTLIRINVNLVQVDAVVVDAKDHPVTDLRKEEFVLLQDGKPQVLTNFSFINTKEGSVRTAPVKAVAAPKGAKAAPPPPTMALKPKQIRRTIALVVDDLGLSFESIARIRQALKKYVDNEMQPGDLVAVIRTGAGMGSLQQFTGDKRLLYAAIDHVKYNGMGRVGVSSIAPLGGEGGMGSENADNEREQIFSAGSLGAIQYVVEGLRDLPGRKSVVLFSENLKLMYNGDPSGRVQDSIRRLGDAANRASVVIYSVDPRGLVVTGLTAADNTRGMTPQQISEVPMQRSQAVYDSQDGMVILATETGGLFLQNDNDISGALKKIVTDGEGYYLLGYHPDASTFDPKSNKPKFHNLQVRVKRPGLRVRYRSGFFGTPDGAPVATPQTRQGQIAKALNSPFSSGALRVRLTTLFSQVGQVGPILNSMLYFEPSQLRFVDEPDDWHKAVIDTVAMTFGENGQAVDSTDKTWTLRLKGESYREVLKVGMVYSLHVPVKKAGAYQMRVVLRDAGSEQVGSASQFIEVPDVSKGHLALSGIVMRSDPPAPKATPPVPGGSGATAAGAAVAPGATPPPNDHAEGQQAEADPLGAPAVRIFKPGAAISYGYQILNAEAGADHKASIEVYTRLFREGELIYTGKPMPMPLSGQDDPKRLVGGGRMQLGGKMLPGDYVLQVIVTDKRAKEKYQVATQSMDFVIQAAQ